MCMAVTAAMCRQEYTLIAQHLTSWVWGPTKNVMAIVAKAATTLWACPIAEGLREVKPTGRVHSLV